MTLAARVRKLVGDVRVAVGLDRLPSYSQARAELGGVPWRKLDATDRWFLESAESLAAIGDASIELAPIMTGVVVRQQQMVAPPIATSETSGVVDLRRGMPWWIYGLVALAISITVVAFR